MPATLTFDSGWDHDIIDLTLDDDAPDIKTNGVRPPDLQAEVWEEPARKRRRVGGENNEDEWGGLEVRHIPQRTR